MTDAILERVRERARSAGEQTWRARFARRDNLDGDAPEWSDYDGGEHGQIVTLSVGLRSKGFKSGGRTYPAGEIYGLYVKSSIVDKVGDGGGWAEYSEGDYCGNGEFLAEEWRMQLLEEVAS